MWLWRGWSSIKHTVTCFFARLKLCAISGLEVIKLEYILRLKIKRNDWLLVDTCQQATNHYALF